MGESKAVRMKPFSLLVIWLEVVIKYVKSYISSAFYASGLYLYMLQVGC